MRPKLLFLLLAFLSLVQARPAFSADPPRVESAARASEVHAAARPERPSAGTHSDSEPEWKIKGPAQAIVYVGALAAIVWGLVVVVHAPSIQIGC